VRKSHEGLPLSLESVSLGTPEAAAQLASVENFALAASDICLSSEPGWSGVDVFINQ